MPNGGSKANTINKRRQFVCARKCKETPPYRMIFLSILLLLGVANTAPLIGTLCQRENPCVDQARCYIDPSAPIIGRPLCLCPPGYDGDGRKDAQGCYDVNECDLGIDDCLSQAETCVNIPGNFKCQCNPGFDRTFETSHCTDIDECRVETVCSGPGVTCLNTFGSYTCVCMDQNKEYKPLEGCVMRDVCVEDNGAHNPCDLTNGICVSSMEGPQCFCKPGFKLGEDGVSCIDIDECVDKRHSCPHQISICRNIPGDYVCDCDESLGFETALGGHQCKQINECIKYLNACPDPAFPCCLDLPPPQRYLCAPGHNDADASSPKFSLGDIGSRLEALHLENWIPDMIGRIEGFAMGGSPVNSKAGNDFLLKWPDPDAQTRGGNDFLSKLTSSNLESGVIMNTLRSFTPPAVANIAYRLRGLENIDHRFPRESNIETSATSRKLEETAAESGLLGRVVEAAAELTPYLLAGPAGLRGNDGSCPAGYVNSELQRRRAVTERIPEAAMGALKVVRSLPVFPSEKLDPNAIAYGLASNVNSFAGQFNDWYQALLALPGVFGDATGELRKVDMAGDLQNAMAKGLDVVQPIYDSVQSLVQEARGSGAILSPVAN